MRSRHRFAGRRLMLILGVALAAAAPVSPALASSAGTYTAINGAGSTWSYVALNQWAENLRTDGIVINFNPDGSEAGRQNYMGGQVNFAASDPPFRSSTDPFDQGGAEISPYGYSYIPDTAGGTSFMYHLDVGGKQITNLRLSGATVAKIFTGQITNWDNKQITHDYGQQLPNIPIIPVVRSDGSGATYFFTRWLSHVYPSLWGAFCNRVSHGKVGGSGKPCGATEFYPGGWGASVSQNGSENVATYISANYGQGAIGYDEYAYALAIHYPVVSLLNPAGYYVKPTASNVAVALTQAQINENASSPNYLQQDLDNVYTYKDPRSYPLSSYSYLVVPRSSTKTSGNFSNADGNTLSTYINYFLCAGQQYSAELGYSPLPLNLVQGGLNQSAKIPGAVPEPSLSSNCNNPTFTKGVLTVLKDAPKPSPCQKAGEPLDCVVVNGKASAPGATPNSGSSASTGNATSPSGSNASTTGPGQSGGGTTAEQGPVTGSAVLVASSNGSPAMVGFVAAALILVAVGAPPAIYAATRRRRRAPR
jgi:ABC-type phosphate transport system substrate-binding protein